MKKTILILFAVAIASVNALAQEPAKSKPKRTPEERAENITKRLTKELNLNAEQQTKTKAVILKREIEREKIAKEVKERQAIVKEEFKQILTVEQYQKFEMKEAEMKKKREERKKHGAPARKGDPPLSAPEEK